MVRRSFAARPWLIFLFSIVTQPTDVISAIVVIISRWGTMGRWGRCFPGTLFPLEVKSCVRDFQNHHRDALAK
jgi:hypothetical protein